MPTTAKLDRAGRFLIPQRFRSELGLAEGSELLVRMEDGELRLTTRDAALKKAQQKLSKFRPPEGNVVDTFLAERRAEALRENK